MPYQATSAPAEDSSPISKQRQREKPQYSLVNSLLQLSKSEVRCYALNMVFRDKFEQGKPWKID